MSKEAVAGERKDKLKHVKLDEVVVGLRFRKDYGNLDELVESIQAKGIIQPLSIDSNMNLLAGGRRYAAAQKAGLQNIPVIIRNFVDEVDSREIELIENIHRQGFTWQEEAALVQEIDRLYKSKDPEWSGRKTAALLDRGVGSISRNIQLARAIEVIPELGEYKTADEALKVLKKMEETAIVEEMRKRQTAHTQSSEDSVSMTRGLKSCLKVADNNYNIGDVFTGLAGMRANGKVDLIECDPPYGIALNEQKASKDSATSNVHSYEEVKEDVYPEFLKKLTKELYRVAGRDCWLVFWFGPTWQQQVLDNLREAGWIVDEIPAIWVKRQGQTMQPEKYFARVYEPFFLCRKGNPVMVERGRANVFDYAGVAGAKKYHPTERPVALIEEILKTLVVGISTVFIPFLGSGATLRACYNLGFQGFGYDLNGEYKNKFMLAVEDDARRLLETPPETE
jgi:ParB family chromosome partitioning protein